MHFMSICRKISFNPSLEEVKIEVVVKSFSRDSVPQKYFFRKELSEINLFITKGS